MTTDEIAAKLKDAGERTLSNVGFSVAGESAVAFGALLMNAASAISETVKWVPINQRLPDLEQSVVLVNIYRWEAGEPERNVYVCGYRATAGCASPEGYWSIRSEPAMSIEAYTHWMPLPEPPK